MVLVRTKDDRVAALVNSYLSLFTRQFTHNLLVKRNTYAEYIIAYKASHPQFAGNAEHTFVVYIIAYKAIHPQFAGNAEHFCCIYHRLQGNLPQFAGNA